MCEQAGRSPRERKQNQGDWLSRDPEIECYLHGVARAARQSRGFGNGYAEKKIEVISGETTARAMTYYLRARIVPMSRSSGAPDQLARALAQPDVWFGSD
jgi:hypothetical protein